MPENLVADIVWSIALATGMAFLARLLRQPPILAYVATGIIFGPGIGLGLIRDQDNIRSIGEIGLILLCFMIGLQIDLKRLLRLGRPVVATGIAKITLTSLLALGLFLLLGFPLAGGRLDAAYLGIALSMSSTMLVVKLLYDRMELDTRAGRITVGILVLEDVFAIFFLAVQPDLQNPKALAIGESVAKGAGLVAASYLASQYVLPRLFHWVARQSELVLLAAVAWCFAVAGLAGFAGLSWQMGALIAGVSISTSPCQHDIVDRIGGLRDFFVTLFFVSLGLQIPSPTGPLLGYALAAAGVVLVSQCLIVFPLLYLMRQGIRASVATAINLGPVSEFSLVLVALGVSYGHIVEGTASIIVFAMLLTSALSTYLIEHSLWLSRWIEQGLARLGLHDRVPLPIESPTSATHREELGQKKIVLLGFHRGASSFLEALEARHPQLLRELLVIDYDPDVQRELTRRHIRCVYGDVSHTPLLAELNVGEARLVLSTIPDNALAGTNNQSLVQQIRQLSPLAQIVVTADTIPAALQMYQLGADYVLLPRLVSADRLLEVLEDGLAVGLSALKEEQLRFLGERREIIS